MSKPDAWMPLWIGDYLADTQRLSLAEHGAYLLLLMDYWRNGAPPDDDAVIARVLGVAPREWRQIRPKISPFFSISDGRWTHRRVEAELAGARERSGKAAAKAKLAASRRWEVERAGRGDAPSNARSNAPSTASGMPGAMLEDMHEQCPSPVTYSVPSEQAASGGPEDPNKEAWRRGKALFTKAGRISDAQAGKLFGRLLRDHGIEARDLLPSIVRAELIGTLDPTGYLTACAKALASKGTAHADAPNVASWGDEVWELALANFNTDGAWSDVMGPRPGEPGCHVPAHLLLKAANA